jgi:hypothetical protein
MGDFDPCESLADSVSPCDAEQFIVEDGPALGERVLTLAAGQQGKPKLDLSHDGLWKDHLRSSTGLKVRDDGGATAHDL